MSDQHQVNQPDDPIDHALHRMRKLLAARGATPHEVAEAIASTPPALPTKAEMAVIDAHEERLDAIAAEYDLVSIWSCGEGVEMDAPHPYPSATTMVYMTVSGVEPESGVRCWGGDGGRFEASITGPRWLDLWLAADMVTRASGDLHHRFVERFDPDTGHPAELRLLAGS